MTIRKRIGADSHELQLIAKLAGIPSVRLAAAINQPRGTHISDVEGRQLALAALTLRTENRAAFDSIWPHIEEALHGRAKKAS